MYSDVLTFIRQRLILIKLVMRGLSMLCSVLNLVTRVMVADADVVLTCSAASKAQQIVVCQIAA